MSTESELQRISTFMDGEAGRFEARAAIGDLLRDPELAERWERWHLIRRGLRREHSDQLARRTAAEVRRAIDADADTDDGLGAQGGGRGGESTFRPLGAALAAGLGLVALALVLRVAGPGGPSPLAGIEQVASSAPRWEQSDPAVRSHLDRLLVNHREASVGLSFGVAAYASVIGYEPAP
jgi:hypothetical protein